LNRFDHFILTRFNLNVAYAEPETRLDPAWLHHRFELFDTVCYPSIHRQSTQNFKWLVFFDADTPNTFKKKVEEYARWNKFVAVYISTRTEEYDRSMIDTIMTHISDGVELIVTTRLDNDDALGVRFVEILHRIVMDKSDNEPEAINFTSGYIWNRSNGKLYRTKYPSNQFISFVESTKKIRTVYCEAHTWFSNIAPVREIATVLLWLQVVHEKNVSNWVHGVRTPVKGLTNFALRAAIPPQNDRLSCYTERGRDSLKRTVKRLAPGLLERLRAWQERQRPN
jgi:hypothetical protein